MIGAFDYIVLGAGSAGCTLASRLSENSNTSVALIEAGGSDGSWMIRMPLGVGELLRSGRHNWNYMSEPEAGLGGRKISHPRGKVLGGSSSINGMVYTRGHALDYDNWVSQFGCDGWGYADVLPYFKRAETSSRGSNLYRGGSGPLQVSVPKFAANPLNSAFIAAGKEAGYPVTQDSNAYQFEGFGPNECTIHNGERWSAAKSYIKPNLKRPNLKIIADSHIDKISIEGARATHVVISRGGRLEVVKAKREIVVCCGAIDSPKLLLLSGLGPADHIRSMGIEVISDIPGVGANLQDHPDLALQYWCKQPVSLYATTRIHQRWLTGIRWFLSRKGQASINQFEVAGYIRTHAGIQYPNLKLEFLPLALIPDSFDPQPGHSFQIHMTLQRAESRGNVTLSSPDASVAPKIRFNYLSHPQDLTNFQAAIRLTREIIAQPAMKEFAGEEIDPGKDVQSDAELDKWIRERVITAYHVSGTCRMGPVKDPYSVVDSQLRVKGISGLRVVDASVMPLVVSSNINAPTIMIAERAADLIQGKKPLLESKADFWTNSNWRTNQR
ncbi:MAG TPA: choline dehydrogenase [Aestuariivirga sp.]|nr:choline dehydrogenase [Aestuariivirga sp.]